MSALPDLKKAETSQAQNPLNDHKKNDNKTSEKCFKSEASFWFQSLRDQITQEFEAIEREYAALYNAQNDKTKDGEGLIPGTFVFTPWDRTEGGGGTIGLMRGNVFEKVGVNISTVYGEFSKEFRGQIPGTDEDPSFWASGISLVAHMKNPHVPAVHMNTRHIVTVGKTWFGGGGDLTPYFPIEEDNKFFHQAYKDACDRYDETYYPKYKKWCDEYFFLPHRNEPRGIGGIFYDYLDTQSKDMDFAFTKDVGSAFLGCYPEIVRRRMMTPWTDEDRQYLLKRRGRYVEFNLLYDRGTLFGLKTGGNVDGILMSMPPEVHWP